MHLASFSGRCDISPEGLGRCSFAQLVPLTEVGKCSKGKALPQLREFVQTPHEIMEGSLGQRRFCRALALSPQATRALRSCSIPTSTGIMSVNRTSACHGRSSNCRYAAHRK